MQQKKRFLAVLISFLVVFILLVAMSARAEETRDRRGVASVSLIPGYVGLMCGPSGNQIAIVIKHLCQTGMRFSQETVRAAEDLL